MDWNRLSLTSIFENLGSMQGIIGAIVGAVGGGFGFGGWGAAIGALIGLFGGGAIGAVSNPAPPTTGGTGDPSRPNANQPLRMQSHGTGVPENMRQFVVVDEEIDGHTYRYRLEGQVNNHNQFMVHRVTFAQPDGNFPAPGTGNGTVQEQMHNPPRPVAIHRTGSNMFLDRNEANNAFIHAAGADARATLISLNKAPMFLNQPMLNGDARGNPSQGIPVGSPEMLSLPHTAVAAASLPQPFRALTSPQETHTFEMTNPGGTPPRYRLNGIFVPNPNNNAEAQFVVTRVTLSDGYGQIIPDSPDRREVNIADMPEAARNSLPRVLALRSDGTRWYAPCSDTNQSCAQRLVTAATAFSAAQTGRPLLGPLHRPVPAPAHAVNVTVLGGLPLSDNSDSVATTAGLLASTVPTFASGANALTSSSIPVSIRDEAGNALLAYVTVSGTRSGNDLNVRSIHFHDSSGRLIGAQAAAQGAPDLGKIGTDDNGALRLDHAGVTNLAMVVQTQMTREPSLARAFSRVGGVTATSIARPEAVRIPAGTQISTSGVAGGSSATAHSFPITIQREGGLVETANATVVFSRDGTSWKPAELRVQFRNPNDANNPITVQYPLPTEGAPALSLNASNGQVDAASVPLLASFIERSVKNGPPMSGFTMEQVRQRGTASTRHTAVSAVVGLAAGAPTAPPVTPFVPPPPGGTAITAGN